MHTYIFDKYGYLVDDEYTREFEFKNWKFKLEANNKSELELQELNMFITNVDNLLFNKGVRIITSKENRLSSDSEYGQLSLVAVNDFNVSINDILQMHNKFLSSFSNEASPLLSSIKDLWIEKVEYIENKVVPSLKIDNYIYETAMVSIIHALGLAENAIDYINDISIDYGDKINEVTLVHKRLTSLNSYDLLNPFNLIVDSPMRDVSDLIKYEIINESDLDSILRNYNVDEQKASILLARILFPTKLFDLLEEHYELKKDIRKEILQYNKQISKMMEKISYIHNYLVNRYRIRPVNWLLFK